MLARTEGRLLWLVATGFFMQTLDSTIVNTALPAMADSLHESPLRMQSVVIAYSLTMAMLIPASGWIAERFGTRKAFLSAIGVFVLGSALCASAPTLHMLVFARVIQGMGGSMLMPVGRLAVMRHVAPERFLQAMSLVSVPGLIGPLIGPTLGGWLSQYSSWHWIFLINIPVGALGSVATWLFMPRERGRHPAAFDLTGYVMIAVAMVSILLSLEGMAELNLPHATVFVLLVFGMAALTGYWLHASQSPHPLFSPQLFGIPTFSVGLLGNLFARIGSGSVPFLLPLTLQVGLGYSPSRAGMMMIPTAVAAIFTKQMVPPLITRFGYRLVLIGNTVLVGLTIASFVAISPAQPLWVRIIQFGFFGAVNSLQFTAMNTLTLKDLGRGGGASSGNSLLAMVQMLSMSMGVAVAAALLGAFTSALAHLGRTGVLSGFHATFICMGLITAAAAWIFSQLAAHVRGRGEEPAVDMG